MRERTRERKLADARTNILRRSQRHSHGRTQCEQHEAGQVCRVPDQGQKCSRLDSGKIISKRMPFMPHFRLRNKRDPRTILLASSSIFLRFALGFSFLSAVADRFGLWGAFGEPNVAWGTFARFVAYTGKLNWFLPETAVRTLAIVSTFVETLFGILLVIGWQTRMTALLSGVLLLLFAVTMTGALGIKAPLDASVFSAAGGAFVLASCGEYPFSIDWLRRHSPGMQSTSSIS